MSSVKDADRLQHCTRRSHWVANIPLVDQHNTNIPARYLISSLFENHIHSAVFTAIRTTACLVSLQSKSLSSCSLESTETSLCLDMAREGAVWTRDRLRQLYDSLDEAVRTASGSHLCSEAVDLAAAATGLTKAQVGNKMRALGRTLSPILKKDAFIQNWTQNATQFKDAISGNPQRSPTSSTRTSPRRSPHQDGAQSSASHPVPPIETTSTLHTRDNVHVEHQQPPSIEQQRNGRHGREYRREDENDDETEAEPDLFRPKPQEIEMIKAWREHMRDKGFGAAPSRTDVTDSLGEIWRSVGHAVKSFCETQPIAFLTTAKMTRATFELARAITGGGSRSDVTECLRTLFGDPAVDVSLGLRAFATAAITVSHDCRHRVSLGERVVHQYALTNECD